MTGNHAERLLAKVKRLPGGCWEWQGASRGGAFRVVPGEPPTQPARAAWELFIGEPPSGKQIFRDCGNPACCAPGHLLALSALEIAKILTREGRRRPQRGEAHWAAKLAASEVETMRIRAGAGASRRSMAAEYGVTIGTVTHVVTGRTWVSVGGPILKPRPSGSPAHIEAVRRAAVHAHLAAA